MILLNSLAQPLSDVQRRRQFETQEAAVPEKVKIKPAPYPREIVDTPSSSSNGLNLPMRSFGPHMLKHYQYPLLQVVNGRKPVKKIAPMMAKTIKDFKNRFSRR